MLNRIFGMPSSKSDPKHTRHDRLSLMVKRLDAIKIYEIAESGNTVVEFLGSELKRIKPCRLQILLMAVFEGAIHSFSIIS